MRNIADEYILVLVLVLALFFVLGVGSEGPIIREDIHSVLVKIKLK